MTSKWEPFLRLLQEDDKENDNEGPGSEQPRAGNLPSGSSGSSGNSSDTHPSPPEGDGGEGNTRHPGPDSGSGPSGQTGDQSGSTDSSMTYNLNLSALDLEIDHDQYLDLQLNYDKVSSQLLLPTSSSLMS
jgi:hypothetical protein